MLRFFLNPKPITINNKINADTIPIVLLSAIAMPISAKEEAANTAKSTKIH